MIFWIKCCLPVYLFTFCVLCSVFLILLVEMVHDIPSVGVCWCTEHTPQWVKAVHILASRVRLWTLTCRIALRNICEDVHMINRIAYDSHNMYIKVFSLDHDWETLRIRFYSMSLDKECWLFKKTYIRTSCISNLWHKLYLCCYTAAFTEWL